MSSGVSRVMVRRAGVSALCPGCLTFEPYAQIGRVEENHQQPADPRHPGPAIHANFLARRGFDRDLAREQSVEGAHRVLPRRDGLADRLTVADLPQWLVVNPQIELPILKIIRRVARDYDGRVADDLRMAGRGGIELPGELEVVARESANRRVVEDDGHD